MLKKRTPLLVGLLMLIGAGAFMMTFGSLEQGVDLDKSYKVDALFSDATGLVDNSRVMLSGIPVGQIIEIRLDEQKPDHARVSMAVLSHIKLHEGLLDPATGTWRNGATAARLQASLLGDYYISLTPGVAGKVLADGDEIRNTITEAGLSAVINQFQEASASIFPKLDKITDDISSITGSLATAIGEGEGTKALEEIRENVRRTSSEVAELSTEVRGFVNDSVISQASQIDIIVGNVRTITEDLKKMSGQFDTRVGSILGNVDVLTEDLKVFVGSQVKPEAREEQGTVAHTLVGIDKSVAVLEGTLESARSIAGKIEAGEGTIGRLVNDDALINNLEGVVKDVRSLTSGLSRLKVKIDVHSEYYITNNALKNYVGFRLHPKPDKFYWVQLVVDQKGTTSKKRRVTTSNDPSKPPVLVEEIVTTEDSLKFTAQFGKRWHFLTFRYGIMESTGGIGLDFDLLEDMLKVQLDVFDFGRNDWPRLRILAGWEFMKHVYISAGIDDVLNGENRDYFVGLGIQFTDEDIKSILPFAPSP